MKFGKIGQFRDVVRDISHAARFVGVVDDQAVYNNDPLPTVIFTGTVKLHGTNAGVHRQGDTLLPLSRNRILSLYKDNYGFASWLTTVEDVFMELLNPGETIFGEWAGDGIQSGVAISKLPKAFYAFEKRIGNNPVPFVIPKTKGIFDLKDFRSYTMTIDFSNPEMVVNELGKITEEVEKECPVAKELGISGVGEGVVWKGWFKDELYRFKVKGEKHSVSKVKTLASVDPEKVANVIEFVEYAVTENRVQQAMNETNATSRTQTGDVLRWVANDILAEESDVLTSNNLIWKDVASKATAKARTIFFNKLK